MTNIYRKINRLFSNTIFDAASPVLFLVLLGVPLLLVIGVIIIVVLVIREIRKNKA